MTSRKKAAVARATRRPCVNRSPWFYHVTPEHNLQSIYLVGILTGKAQTKLKEVWLCTAKKVKWAIEHVAKRHSVPVESVAVIEVAIGANSLWPRGRGLYTSPKSIHPKSLRQWKSTGTVSG